MKALVQTTYGSTDVLEIQDRPPPLVAEGQVLIRVRACGVGFADLEARMGLYLDGPKPPCVGGFEVSGEVDAVGDGVDRFSPGDRVFAATRFHAFQELAVAECPNVGHLPDRLTFEQGAALGWTNSSAYAVVARYANVQPDDRVLIHVVAGSSGIAAMQLCRRIGADVIGTAGASKHEALRKMGLERVVDYHVEHVGTRVRELTDGEGVDVVLDPRGGSDLREDYHLLRHGGRLVISGARQVVGGRRRSLTRAARIMARMPAFHPQLMLRDSRSVLAVNLLRLWDRYGSLEPFLRPVEELAAEDVLAPIVAAALPLHRAGDAHEMMLEHRNVGKIVLTID